VRGSTIESVDDRWLDQGVWRSVGNSPRENVFDGDGTMDGRRQSWMKLIQSTTKIHFGGCEMMRSMV
jgi:hypothetical protein